MVIEITYTEGRGFQISVNGVKSFEGLSDEQLINTRIEEILDKHFDERRKNNDTYL